MRAALEHKVRSGGNQILLFKTITRIKYNIHHQGVDGSHIDKIYVNSIMQSQLLIRRQAQLKFYRVGYLWYGFTIQHKLKFKKLIIAIVMQRAAIFFVEYDIAQVTDFGRTDVKIFVEFGIH